MAAEWVLLLEGVMALAMLAMSFSQPFPTPSRRASAFVLLLVLLMAIGEQAERPASIDVHVNLMIAIGVAGVLLGAWMLRPPTHDVLMAPFGGALLTIGMLARAGMGFEDLGQLERYLAFGACAGLAAFETWLVFRCLLIGSLPETWSRAGLDRMRRGNLTGRGGAIEAFERAWAVDQPHLNPMAYLALERLNRFLGRGAEADGWLDRLNDEGGADAVDSSWSKEVLRCLEALDPERVRSLVPVDPNQINPS